MCCPQTLWIRKRALLIVQLKMVGHAVEACGSRVFLVRVPLLFLQRMPDPAPRLLRGPKFVGETLEFGKPPRNLKRGHWTFHNIAGTPPKKRSDFRHLSTQFRRFRSLVGLSLPETDRLHRFAPFLLASHQGFRDGDGDLLVNLITTSLFSTTTEPWESLVSKGNPQMAELFR